MEDQQAALIYNMRASILIYYLFMKTHSSSSSLSCLIDEGNTFLITGGYPYIATVSRYNSDGWIEDIGSLNTGRSEHGCTRYTNNFGVEVTYIY